MKGKVTLVLIGAGSITFTPKVLRDMVNHPALGGSTLRLVDLDAERLEVMTRLAGKINDTLEKPWEVEAFTDRRKALPGADYIIVSVDVERIVTWDSDWRIPAELGVRQVTGELGGPGGLFHSLRQVPLHIEIGRDIAEQCPNATVMVESNPLNRICLAMRRYTEIGTILGLCHGVEITQWRLGEVLGLETDEILATAAGVNHFTWILDLRHRDTGEDLYPELKRRLANYTSAFWPLSRKLYDVYGYFPSCGDEHIGEYLPFAWELVGMTGPQMAGRAADAQEFWKYLKETAYGQGPLRKFAGAKGAGAAEERTDFFLEPRTWKDTLAFPIMDAVATNKVRRMPAVNMENHGAISNLPADVFVEAPAAVDASGCRLLSMGELPKGPAAFSRREIDQMEMTVEAAVSGKRGAILQAMLLDPVIDSIATAEKVLAAMLEANAGYLPQFA